MFFVDATIKQLVNEFDKITVERKNVLKQIAAFVSSEKTPKLVFICTHNSRRSHIAQIWAITAGAYFNVDDVHCYSGGTEATAFNPGAVKALQKLGYRIDQITTGINPHYSIQYSETHPAFEVFSKKYDDPENPSTGFAAIMTCTDADENCPVVTGSSARIPLPFDDPKEFDDTDLEAAKYNERSLWIGREILYTFSQIKRQ